MTFKSIPSTFPCDGGSLSRSLGAIPSPPSLLQWWFASALSLRWWFALTPLWRRFTPPPPVGRSPLPPVRQAFRHLLPPRSGVNPSLFPSIAVCPFPPSVAAPRLLGGCWVGCCGVGGVGWFGGEQVVFHKVRTHFWTGPTTNSPPPLPSPFHQKKTSPTFSPLQTSQNLPTTPNSPNPQNPRTLLSKASKRFFLSFFSAASSWMRTLLLKAPLKIFFRHSLFLTKNFQMCLGESFCRIHNRQQVVRIQSDEDPFIVLQ